MENIETVDGKRSLPHRGTPGAVICLILIVGLAAFLHFYNLSAIGNGNVYYTAAVKSMLQSWRNFFFVAAEPGGSVTVDKPPLGLWIEALSAAIFGANGFAVVLPNILAGLAGIVAMYFIVRKRHGEVAGLIAALVIAITPIAIATQRNNTVDGMLTFSLILVTWAFLKATETGQARYLWLGALLVGVGFNIKMLQAFLPLPAFFALYFLGAKASIGRKILNLAIAGVIILGASFWWVAIVDLTPADQRPFVGSTEDNLMSELIFSHNGLERLLGRGQGIAAIGQTRTSGAQSGRGLPGSRNGSASSGRGGGSQMPGGAGYSSSETGEAGWLRFWIAPLSAELSWLLPLAAVGMVVMLLRRPQWPIGPEHRALVAWGGWLVTGWVFFSIAGHFHAYYLTMLAPPLGAVIGIGAAGLSQQCRQGRRWAGPALTVAVAVTVAYQAFNARQFQTDPFWLPVSIGLIVVGAVLLCLPAARRRQTVGMAAIVFAVMAAPLYWSWMTNQHGQGGRIALSYHGDARGGPNNSQSAANPTILSYLEAHMGDTRYLVAVQSALGGADYVLESGRPGLYMGGFAGDTPVVTTDDIARMVAAGELRYILSGGGMGRGQSGISTWVAANCTPVNDLNAGGGRSASILYDCAATP